MTFEEFFNKKRINLDELQKADPGLYAEFKSHFNEMGEKSFDHTKKYWFNRLRHLYQLPAEAATPPKPKPAATVATGTIAAEVVATEQADTVKPKGFTPRFKAGTATSKAATEEPTEEAAPTTESTGIDQPTTAKPKGFTPRFKAGATTTKPADETPTEKASKAANETAEDTALQPEANAKPKGFTPRFKAGVTTAKPTEDKPAEAISEPAATPAQPQEQAITSAPKGFKPRFKAGVTTTKPTVDEPVAPSATLADENSTQTEAAPEEQPESKPAYKPRFNMQAIKKASDNGTQA